MWLRMFRCFVPQHSSLLRYCCLFIRYSPLLSCLLMSSTCSPQMNRLLLRYYCGYEFYVSQWAAITRHILLRKKKISLLVKCHGDLRFRLVWSIISHCLFHYWANMSPWRASTYNFSVSSWFFAKFTTFEWRSWWSGVWRLLQDLTFYILWSKTCIRSRSRSALGGAGHIQ